MLSTSSAELLGRFKRSSIIYAAVLRLVEHCNTLDLSTKPCALVVGGFVRDLLLNIEATDADIEVYKIEAGQLEKILNELFPERVNVVGRAFGVFKIALEAGYELDVALPRRESKIGVGHKDFRVDGDPNLSPNEATRRRDFTINAILFDPQTGKLIDPWNGIQDLQNGVLRMVDEHHFGEDPLRVYRAVQFAARFHLTVEARTLDVLRKMVKEDALEHLPAERVTEEWRKLLLKSDKPSIGLEIMRELGIIKKYYPELDTLIGVEQDPEWHPEGDVWIHTLMSVDVAAKIVRRAKFDERECLQIVLGALCHDLGKASTTRLAPKQGVMRLRSLGHEEAGVEPTRTFCQRLCFGNDINHAAIMAAQEHLKPGMLNRAATKENWSEDRYANAVRKLLKRIHPVSWQVLASVAEADYRGRTLAVSSAPHYTDGERLEATVKKYRLDQTALRPLLEGRDLAALGVTSGPSMGELIRAVEHARDQGEITTKQEAIEFVKDKLIIN